MFIGVLVMVCSMGDTIWTTLPRGERLHNPGCIRTVKGQVWEGQAEEQTDPDLVVFKSDHWGLRAMARVLGNYQKRHGLKTVKEIITRWCGRENAKDYVAFVLERNKWNSEWKLDLTRCHVIIPMMSAIIRWENGREYAGGEVRYTEMKAAVVAAWPEWFKQKE